MFITTDGTLGGLGPTFRINLEPIWRSTKLDLVTVITRRTSGPVLIIPTDWHPARYLLNAQHLTVVRAQSATRKIRGNRSIRVKSISIIDFDFGEQEAQRYRLAAEIRIAIFTRISHLVKASSSFG